MLLITFNNMSSRASRTIYVGNLPGDVREREIEDLFYKVLDSSAMGMSAKDLDFEVAAASAQHSV